MLNNLTNFFNLITGGLIKKTASPTDLIALGTKNPRFGGGYRPTAITALDFQNQILSLIDQTSSIWSNGFINTGCINADITLPDNSTFDYVGPLTMCTGKTLTVPSGTTLTII